MSRRQNGQQRCPIIGARHCQIRIGHTRDGGAFLPPRKSFFRALPLLGKALRRTDAVSLAFVLLADAIIFT
jgi:hypothetical protein